MLVNLKLNKTLNYWWAWIVLISFLAYYPAIDNFFGWDDFLWLYRAKTLSVNPTQMFQSEGLYFDPIIYLSFWFDFILFGLDYRCYHITDITLHAVNGLLVFQFVKLYSEDRQLAFLSGLMFASTFAASDAILWSSSRVDLLTTMFSLITIIFFLKYIKVGKTPFYVASVATYIIALAAKGTAIVIPILLLWLFTIERKATKKIYSIFIPFIAIPAGYFILLSRATSTDNPASRAVLHPNTYSYSLSLTSLFIPEQILAKLNLSYTFPITYGLLFILWRIRFSPHLDRSKTVGIVMMLLFLTPLLILGNLEPVSSDVFTYHLLNSPSHRIYLASIGMAIFVSSFVLSIVKEARTKTLIVFITLSIFSFNVFELRQREKLWESGTSEIKDSVFKLKKLKPRLPDHSEILFIDFPLPSAFFEPCIKLYYELNDVRTVSVLWKRGTEFPNPKDNNIDVSKKYFVFLRSRNSVSEISTDWWTY